MNGKNKTRRQFDAVIPLHYHFRNRCFLFSQRPLSALLRAGRSRRHIGRRNRVRHCATGRRPLGIRVDVTSRRFRTHMRPAASRGRRPGSAARAIAAAALPLLAACAVAAADCRLPDSLRAEIAGYRPVAERVLSYVRGAYRGRTWTELSVFVDTFGSRLAGTPNLEDAIDYTLDKLKASRLDNVHAERVQFTGWQRFGGAPL